MIISHTSSMSEKSIPIHKRVQHFKTAEDGAIYQLPLEAFPDFWVYAYVVLIGDYRILIDSGSGMEESNRDLEEGFKQVASSIGSPFGLNVFTHVLITHGHIDHFGGLSYVADRTRALIGIHELDRRNLTDHQERYGMAARRLEVFLTEAGLRVENQKRILEMYSSLQALFQVARVDFTFEEIGMRLGPFEFIHVPGHSAGQVVIRLHDILFSGDHILAGISPHQAPECLMLNTGLSHYLPSLSAVSTWGSGVRLTLGGHNAPITDLESRVQEIQKEHETRFAWILEYLASPHSIVDIAQELFGPVSGYNELLAIEEAGAHVEYLYERGALRIANLDEVIAGPTPVPIYYCRQG
jgi:glyoxylase-like metal-dependent hydrolase (beta-lactamase superfamily II)